MQKILLLSNILMLMTLPIMSARRGTAKRGMRRAVLAWAGYNAFYCFALLYIYPRLE
jgi:hypothetical protein